MLVLYYTLGCHLCELAEAILLEQNVAFKKHDIADDEDLMDKYAWSIPVLFNPNNNQELAWPFDAGQLSTWLSAKR